MRQNLRQSNFELLRFLAMMFIITGHLLGDNGANLLGKCQEFSLQWYVLWAVEAFCAAGTNCFVLISGYFMIDSKFTWKKVLKLCVQVWLYSWVLYGLSVLLGINRFNIRDLVKVATPILGRNWWFISTYIGLYIVSPYINSLLKQLDVKQYKKLIVILVCLFSITSTIYPITDTFAIGGGAGIVWFVTLYIVASFIRLHPEEVKIQKKTKIGLYFISVSLIIFSKYLISFVTMHFLGRTVGTSLLYGNNSIINLVASVLLFLLFVELEIPEYNKLHVIINKVGGVAFGVYLIHNCHYINEFMWSVVLRFYNGKLINSLILVIIAPLVIYVVCGCIEYIRKILFEQLENRFKSCK